MAVVLAHSVMAEMSPHGYDIAPVSRFEPSEQQSLPRPAWPKCRGPLCHNLLLFWAQLSHDVGADRCGEVRHGGQGRLGVAAHAVHHAVWLHFLPRRPRVHACVLPRAQRHGGLRLHHIFFRGFSGDFSFCGAQNRWFTSLSRSCRGQNGPSRPSMGAHQALFTPRSKACAVRT